MHLTSHPTHLFSDLEGSDGHAFNPSPQYLIFFLSRFFKSTNVHLSQENPESAFPWIPNLSVKEAKDRLSLLLELKEVTRTDDRNMNLAVQNPDKPKAH